MAGAFHEIRDPIHTFIRLDSAEREVVDSRPLQRLRHVHQLATTYLIYPAATHKRFEHSLGVMELAGRVFDVVTKQENVTDEIRKAMDELVNRELLSYWRRVLRMAALCHDIGHLPFSHAAEGDLLPEGWDHERLTRALINSDEMSEIWDSHRPALNKTDIEKLAVGPKKARDLEFTDWESILSEIIVGDAFGVDRMDYLLRDSHHAGVAYGKFDHHRLIDTLRILPAQAVGPEGSPEPVLGIEQGGIQSAESLMMARYLMYSQVYFHHVRRIYDIHLCDFLKEWLPGGRFGVDVESHLGTSDNQILEELSRAASDEKSPGNRHARALVRRDHFRLLYERNPHDVEVNPEAGEAVFGVMVERFGADFLRHDRYRKSGGLPEFPVLMRDERVVGSLAESEVLNNIPAVSVDYVFCDRSCYDDAKSLLSSKHDKVIQPKTEEQDGKN